ncbi:MAG: hypothetical protein ACTMIR_15370 [Cellulomonadaceae bacterium]
MTTTFDTSAALDATLVRAAAAWLIRGIEAVDVAALRRPAGSGAWSCWQTLEHVVDDLIAYALQLAARPPLGYVPVVGTAGSADVVRVDPESGTGGMTEALTAASELLATQVEAAPRDARAYHPLGLTDASGFAAMGTVGLLIHGYDVLTALTGTGTPFPEGTAARGLTRLFPDVSADGAAASPDALLLWATGRIELAGHPRRSRWQWDVTVRS